MANETSIENLIARVLAGEASGREKRQLERWRRAAPANERAFQEFARVWTHAEAEDSRAVVSSPPPVRHIIAEAERRRALVIPAVRSRAPRRHRLVWAAAAAMAIAVGLGVFKMVAGTSLVLATGPTETTTTQLVDGSVIRLGPSSRVVVRGVDQRSVDLVGSAFFAVRTDSKIPFVVRTGVGDAVVLGTRFEIRADADSLRLVVVEGRVSLSAAGKRVEVDKGNVSRIVAGSAPSAPETVNVWRLLEWTGGLLIFQATPLDQVVEEVAVYFETPIVVRDTLLSGRTVTAWFENEPFEEVATTICQVVGARCVLGDTLEIGT